MCAALHSPVVPCCSQPGNWTLYQVNPNPLIAFTGWACYSLNSSSGNWSSTPLPNITDTITLLRGSSTACVAQYIVLPPMPRLALLARLPDIYTGSTPRLQATDANTSTLTCNTTTRWAPSNNITVTSPGDGLCGAGSPSNGTVPVGTYNVTAALAAAAIFARWECYNISTGNATAINVTAAGNSAAFSLPLGSAVTCVAVYDVLPRLALLAQLPAAYNDTAMPLLAATGNLQQCIKFPSARLDANNVSIAAPGSGGLCNSDTTGTMAVGSYGLGAPNEQGATVFAGWQCYNISNSNATLLNMTVPPSIELQLNAVMTCVAVFQMKPQLALLSQVNAPAGFPYSGTGAALLAAGPKNCSKPQSSLVSGTVNATSPGTGGQCPAANVAVGQYMLSQTPPAGTTFKAWECYNVANGSAGAPASGNNVTLALNDVWTCIASEWRLQLLCLICLEVLLVRYLNHMTRMCSTRAALVC